MRRTLVALAVALIVPLASASAQGRVRDEARDVRQARRELHDDQRDRRQAVRAGDTREVRQETREIKRDKREIRQEKRDVKRAVIRHRHR